MNTESNSHNSAATPASNGLSPRSATAADIAEAAPTTRREMLAECLRDAAIVGAVVAGLAWAVLMAVGAAS